MVESYLISEDIGPVAQWFFLFLIYISETSPPPDFFTFFLQQINPVFRNLYHLTLSGASIEQGGGGQSEIR